MINDMFNADVVRLKLSNGRFKRRRNFPLFLRHRRRRRRQWPGRQKTSVQIMPKLSPEATTDRPFIRERGSNLKVPLKESAPVFLDKYSKTNPNHISFKNYVNVLVGLAVTS